VPTETLLQWGSTNGAEALGLPATRHSIAPGSYPALIHLGGIDPEAPMLHDHITIAPLIP
jgi:hypothetical protein